MEKIPKLFHVKKSLIKEFLGSYPVSLELVSSEFSSETVIVVDDGILDAYVSIEDGVYKGVLFVSFDEFRIVFDMLIRSWANSIQNGKLDYKKLMEIIVNEFSRQN